MFRYLFILSTLICTAGCGTVQEPDRGEDPRQTMPAKLLRLRDNVRTQDPSVLINENYDTLLSLRFHQAARAIDFFHDLGHKDALFYALSNLNFRVKLYATKQLGQLVNVGDVVAVNELVGWLERSTYLYSGGTEVQIAHDQYQDELISLLARITQAQLMQKDLDRTTRVSQAITRCQEWVVQVVKKASVAD